MKCPYCSNYTTRVVDKRDNNDTGVTRRRRECQKCFKRFTTYEKIESVDLTVIKRDKSKENFDKEKLKRGISRAFTKRPFGEEKIDSLVDEIEMKLLNSKSNIIESKEIGKLVLRKLKKIDEIAYLRFASVYKGFDDIKDFEMELDKL